MKKVLAILTFAIMTLAAVFADPTLQITATVKPVAPEFTMKGGFTNGTYDKTAEKTVSATSTLVSAADPSCEDITVYIQLLQATKTKYKKAVIVTITATDLATTGYSDVATVTPKITSAKIENDNFKSEGSVSDKSAVFTLTYKNGKPISANTEVGTASFTWAKNADLPAGNYSATITMSYEAN